MAFQAKACWLSDLRSESVGDIMRCELVSIQPYEKHISHTLLSELIHFWLQYMNLHVVRLNLISDTGKNTQIFNDKRVFIMLRKWYHSCNFNVMIRAISLGLLILITFSNKAIKLQTTQAVATRTTNLSLKCRPFEEFTNNEKKPESILYGNMTIAVFYLVI